MSRYVNLRQGFGIGSCSKPAGCIVSEAMAKIEQSGGRELEEVETCQICHGHGVSGEERWMAGSRVPDGGRDVQA